MILRWRREQAGHEELMPARTPPIGVILAGGAGMRIGGSKAMVHLHGRPLISYPLTALTQALPEVVIVAKPSTELPSLPGITVWLEPESPRHPLLGITHALGLAEGRPVLVCAADLPFVRPGTVGRIAAADPRGAPAVIASAGGQTQPLLGCYQPAALELVSLPSDRPLRDVIAGIGARTIEVDPGDLFNVNYPEDLLQAAALLDQPNVKS
jgi:molybdopterin-guanine dinucleotide biosynthesis protein A